MYGVIVNMFISLVSKFSDVLCRVDWALLGTTAGEEFEWGVKSAKW